MSRVRLHSWYIVVYVFCWYGRGPHAHNITHSTGPQPLHCLQILTDPDKKKEGEQGSKERIFHSVLVPHKVTTFIFNNVASFYLLCVHSAAEKEYALALSVKEPILLLI